MKVLLCGYHEAGCRALRTLVARGHEVVVATHEPTPGVPNLADHARALRLPVTVDEIDALREEARRFKPDIIFSVYYRSILPPDVLSLSRLGGLNFHPSLLPRHRGCFSAPWAIIEGDRETGVTCHHMIEQVDAGNVIDREIVAIVSSDTGMSLYYKLVDATLRVFDRLLTPGSALGERGSSQHGAGTHHSRHVPFNGVIDLLWPRERIDRFIRALFFPPYPPAELRLDGRVYEVRTMADFDRLMHDETGVEVAREHVGSSAQV